MYPEASSDVTVQMIIDWACAGLTFLMKNKIAKMIQKEE